MTADKTADVVIVGAGPVGLWTAIQVKKRNPALNVQIYERHAEYQRAHVLKLEHFSMLLYGKRSRDPREQAFYKEVTGKSLTQIFKAAATGSVFIRTNDLEAALKSYAAALGVDIAYKKVEDPQTLMQEHPGCKMFVAADGAHSRMRTALLGEDAVRHFPLQHVVEIKYQVDGRAEKLEFLGNHFKTNKLLSHMAFEYVGREKEGVTPVTLRFFVDKATYEAMPEASFKEPLTLQDPRLPPALAQDIKTYMNVRKTATGEEYREGSAKLSKLVLSLYAAKNFAVNKGDRSWFFVGDAAMGVPYFRALNSGIIIGSQLGHILTRSFLSSASKARVYNFYRPFDVAWEFTAARGKDLAIKGYDFFRKASNLVPWQMKKWNDADAEDFRTRNHRAFRPGDDPQP